MSTIVQRRRRPRISATISIAALCALAGLSACAAPRPLPVALPATAPSPRLPHEMRAGLDIIAVVVHDIDTVVAAEAQPPRVSGSAARGALEGAAMTVYVGGLLAGPYGVMLGIALAPVGAAAGAISEIVGHRPVGPSTDEPHPAVVFRRAISDVDLPSVLLEAAIGASSDLQVRVVPAIREAPDKAVDAVLHLNVLGVGVLPPPHGGSQLLEFTVAVRARLVRTTDERELLIHTFSDTGSIRPINAWVADRGNEFRRDLVRVPARLVEHIVRSIFSQE